MKSVLPKEQLQLISKDEDLNTERLTYVVNSQNPKSLLPPDELVDAHPPQTHEFTVQPVTTVKEKSKPVPIYQERVKFVKVKKVVERPVEVVREVEKVIVQEEVIPKQVESGEVVEIPVPYDVEKKVYVADYHDTPVEYCVAQSYQPIVQSLSPNFVDCNIYEPKLKIVDVFVPKITNGCIELAGTDVRYKPVESISKVQWNSIVLKLNSHLCDYGDIDHLPVHKNTDGTVIAYKTDEPIGAPLASLT